MAGTDFVVATQAFATVLDGVEVIVHRGENVRAGHPLVASNPEKFQPLELSTRWDVVEQATAAPGEKRDPGRGRRDLRVPQQ